MISRYQSRLGLVLRSLIKLVQAAAPWGSGSGRPLGTMSVLQWRAGGSRGMRVRARMAGAAATRRFAREVFMVQDELWGMSVDVS